MTFNTHTGFITEHETTEHNNSLLKRFWVPLCAPLLNFFRKSTQQIMKEFSGGRGGGEANWCGMCFSLILFVQKKIKNLLWGTKKNKKNKTEKEGNRSSKSNPPHTKCWCIVRGHCEQPLRCCCDHLISEVNPLKSKRSLNSSTFYNGCCAVCLSSHIRCMNMCWFSLTDHAQSRSMNDISDTPSTDQVTL